MNQALDRLRSWGAETAIILGSGLNSLVENADASERLPYSDFPDLPAPKVPGHSGEFALGQIGGERIVFARGRVHLYEGHTAHAVTASIRLLAAAGIKRVILTNAAGTANPDFPPGALDDAE